MNTIKTRWRDIPWSEIAPFHGDTDQVFKDMWEKEQRGKEIVIEIPSYGTSIEGCKELNYSIPSAYSPDGNPGWACCSHLAEIGD